MKKILVLCFFLLLNNFSYSQERTFLGEYIDLYREAKFVLSKDYVEYRNEPINNNEFTEGRALFLRHMFSGKSNSKKDKKKKEDDEGYVFIEDIKGDTLKVVKVDFEKKKSIIGRDYYNIYLTSINTGKNYVFEYNDKAEYEFPFHVVSPLNISNDYFCGEIFKETDEFSEKEITRTKPSDITFLKEQNNSGVSYYLSLMGLTRSASAAGKEGVIILLRNGERLSFPDAQIEVKAGGVLGYVVSSFLPLAKNELEILSSNPIKGYRLFNEDNMLTDFESARYLSLLKCLLN